MARNGSIVKALTKCFGEEEVDVMVRGAALLGWTDLRGLNSVEGLGRRWAIEAFWRGQNQRKAQLPESLGSILRKAMTKP